MAKASATIAYRVWLSFIVLLAAADASAGKVTVEFCKPDKTPITREDKLAPQVPTFIVIHGFTGFVGKAVLPPMYRQAEALQKRYPKANVVVVQWDVQVRNLISAYPEQVEASPGIGAQIAKWMNDRKVQPAKTVISAHSLGTHIAAFASNECEKQPGGRRVYAIVAADPAGPIFEQQEEAQNRPENADAGDQPAPKRLDKTDADKVIVVHTTEKLGFEAPCGTTDMYVVFDKPTDFITRHSLAFKLITDTLADPNNSPVPFLSKALEFDFKASKAAETESDR